MRVVLSGATGLIGVPLVRRLLEAGDEPVVLSRSASGAGRRLPAGVRVVEWDPAAGVKDAPAAPLLEALDGAGAAVNLAGASIGTRRWTAARKKVLLDSRVDSTRVIVRGIAALPAEHRPSVLVNASGIDFYGDDPSERVYMEGDPPGDTFLASVCRQWEAAAQEAEPLGVRVVRLRTSLVLAPDAVALKMLALPFRIFFGGPLGNGRQWFNWIHLEDEVGLAQLALRRTELSGPLNAVAPDVRRQAEAARAVGRALSRPSWAPAPASLLRLVLGEQADLLLHGRLARPQAALQHGYQFRHANLDEALTSVLREDDRAGASTSPPARAA